MAETIERKLPGEWAKSDGIYDCSMFIGQLYDRSEKPAWPMYSFDRPSTILWNAIANGLYQRGWNDDQIKEWLQSKGPRWALDRSLGDAITALGAEYAKTI